MYRVVSGVVDDSTAYQEVAFCDCPSSLLMLHPFKHLSVANIVTLVEWQH